MNEKIKNLRFYRADLLEYIDTSLKFILFENHLLKGFHLKRMLFVINNENYRKLIVVNNY
jgi:hypothetical protein